ncbi:2-amino-4-hydroxy-6-hydroxymethyldihydropteridine diphosphokinase [Tumebacillus permanentifrigoris]|uniref:2-amino-4-hydroxy-6-hydroxymethyldihydropteridine diphosphokinase n=1 Tax=Tumebacillus permanentifrigoris TaxID=378543 RepID=A0A316D5B8_9BACL|nr:2-amino-4-hydroxy-6-hydroxymethyldihydropteridine diphosphokinase [Tumebacillus permanentifrigoris]PWK07846.1 2-amino-4-hydroxy-6-hydroxymethyldihydropteridine diphosphokinase [Tumebacillus permanentifrigoris]
MDASKVQTAYLSLGSNLGDRRLNLRTAIAILDAHPEIDVTRVSPIYETEPVGYLDQPDFLNLVLELQTELDAKKLWKITSSTELELGRQRDIKWGPRTIDIDILLVDHQVMDTDDLIIPHPRMADRAFVLLPLADLAGDLVHPVTRQTVSVMANRVEGKDGVYLCKIPLANDYEPTEN